MRTSVVEQQLRWADAIMMVYSITDVESFRQLKNTASKMIEKALDLEEREQRYASGLYFSITNYVFNIQVSI